MITRYGWTKDQGHVVQHDGPFVKYEEYEILESRLYNARALLAQHWLTLGNMHLDAETMLAEMDK